MSTITYKCDTCKRSSDLLENKSGLTQFSKCVITNGCNGKLYKVAVNPDNIRETNLPYIPGLRNYQQRKAFFSYTQVISKTEWIIKHDMGISPVVIVYQNVSGNLTELDQRLYSVQIIDSNSVSLKFNSPMRGLAHLIARTTDSTDVITASPIEAQFNITNSGVFTFAVPSYITLDEGQDNPETEVSTPSFPFYVCESGNKIYIEIELTIPNREPIYCIEELDDLIDARSPWLNWNNIIVKSRKNYCVKTIDILKIMFMPHHVKIRDF